MAAIFAAGCLVLSAVPVWGEVTVDWDDLTDAQQRQAYEQLESENHMLREQLAALQGSGGSGAGTPGPGTAELFAAGMDLGDFTAQPARLEILRAGEESSLAEVTVAEGKFHQVKRMFAAAGHEVLQLHRRAFGPLELDPGLREGEWRELKAEELAALRHAAGMNQSTEDT